MRVAIIEDEIMSQQLLRNLINSHYPNFEIVVILDTVDKSIVWFKHNTIDLVFMDIRLYERSSFEIFEQVEINAPIIFCTAYDNYAIDAFNVNGVAYILKPINKNKLIQAVEKIKGLNFVKDQPIIIKDIAANIRENINYKDRFFVKIGEKFVVVEVENIAYFFSEKGITYIITNSNEKYIVDFTLEALCPLLNPKYFYRLSRACIAHVHSIGSITKQDFGKLKIELNPNVFGNIIVSRRRSPSLLEWLKGE